MNSRLRAPFLAVCRSLIDPRWLVMILLLTLIGTIYLQYRYDPWRQYRVGLSALEKNDLPVVQTVARSLEAYPTYASHVLYLTAALALREGDVKTALERASAAKENPELAIEANVLAGEAAYKIGAAGNAKLHWEEALRTDPECVTAHRWLGVLYYDLGAMDNAMLHLGAVSRLAPTDPRADRLMGLMNRDYERPETAIPHYKESLRRAPKQRDADEVRLEMTECQIKLREFAEGLKTLENCTDTPRKKILSARCLLNLGSLDEARQIANSLLATDRSRLDVLQINAEIALADGKLPLAAELLQVAAEVDPYNHGIRTQLAQVLGRLGQTEGANKQTERADELQKLWQRFSDLQIEAINRSTDAPVRYEIGSLAKQLGKPELAITWFRAALAIDPSLRSAADAIAEMMPPPSNQPNAGPDKQPSTNAPSTNAPAKP
ncbi:MAG: tetratricopeptide repeat protein [Pirellulaceae bacterium]|nr:tetratricopeptide repeat protein [Pirellulaceae bacterium]